MAPPSPVLFCDDHRSNGHCLKDVLFVLLSIVRTTSSHTPCTSKAMESNARHSHLAPEILPIDSALQPYHSSSDLQIAVVSEKEVVNNDAGLERRLEEGKKVMGHDNQNLEKHSYPSKASRNRCNKFFLNWKYLTCFGLAGCFFLAFFLMIPAVSKENAPSSGSSGNGTIGGTGS